MKGRQTPPEKIYAVMAMWSITNNYSETARKLKMPQRTVEKLVKENKDKEEYAKLCEGIRGNFESRATTLIKKIMDRIEETIDNPEYPIPLNQLSSALSQLYDKRALARGEATENTKIVFELPKEVKAFAD